MSVDCTAHCVVEGCENTFKNHRWGSSQASKKGWFLQKDGKFWCPEHVPEWVKNWRAKKKNDA